MSEFCNLCKQYRRLIMQKRADDIKFNVGPKNVQLIIHV